MRKQQDAHVSPRVRKKAMMVRKNRIEKKFEMDFKFTEQEACKIEVKYQAVVLLALETYF